jgi:hypothetical protein
VHPTKHVSSAVVVKTVCICSCCSFRYLAQRDTYSENDIEVQEPEQPSHGRGRRFICPPKRPDRLRGLPSLLFSGYRGSLPEVKLPGREADHLSLSNGEVRNQGSLAASHVLYGVRTGSFTVRGYGPRGPIMGCVFGVSYGAINQLTVLNMCVFVHATTPSACHNIWRRKQVGCPGSGGGGCK